MDRPGRFHHIVNFELPKAEHREAMIKLWTDNIDERLLGRLVEQTDGFSGAHLKELVEFAKMIAEEDDIEIGDAMLLSLDKLTEQRELIEEIRENKTDTKEFWGKLKYAPISGIFVDLEKKDALRVDVSDEVEEGKGVAIGVQQGEKKEELPVDMKTYLNAVYKFDEILEEIKELKEGRVLSRKLREAIKNAITALNAVLKADTTGSREDEESETGTVTERTVEIEKEGEREFSKEDIAKIVQEVSGKQMGEVLEGAFKKALDPEKIKAMVSDGIRLELDKLRGKVT